MEVLCHIPKIKKIKKELLILSLHKVISLKYSIFYKNFNT